MTEAELPELIRRLLWAAFALGAMAGAVAQATRFCTMGALADWFSYGGTARLRQWVLAVALAVLGFNAGVALGWWKAADSIYSGRTLMVVSLPVGGLLFGVGMVLASGCGFRNLVRLGGGNLKSAVVLAVMAISTLATLKGLTAVLRTQTVDRLTVPAPVGQDLPSVLAAATGWPLAAAAAGLGAGVGLLLLAWVLARPEGRQRETWMGGGGMAALVLGAWWLSGQVGHLGEHPATLEEVFLATASRRMEAVSFSAPLGLALEWLVYFSDQSQRLTMGLACLAGVFTGAALTAWRQRTWRLEGFGSAGDLGLHLLGAVLMGIGGVTALGCSIGQGLSGLSTLSSGSVLAVAGMVLGVALGLRWQNWRLERL